MTQPMTVKTFLNDGPGRFWRYESGDLLYPGPMIDLVDMASEAEALDAAWTVGNKMPERSAISSWPRTVRSLSAGDVLVIGETAWKIDGIGFSLLDPDDLRRSLEEPIHNDRGAFGPPRF